MNQDDVNNVKHIRCFFNGQDEFHLANCQERTRLARDGVAEHCEWFRWQKQDPYLDENV